MHKNPCHDDHIGEAKTILTSRYLKDKMSISPAKDEKKL